VRASRTAISAFGGVVTGQSMQFPLDDLMSFNGTIKVSGRPELVIGVSA
jgi:hypothetical protein